MVRGLQAHPGEVIDVFAVGEYVHRLPRQVAAFGQDPAGPQGLQAPGRFFQVLGGLDFKPGEAGGLRGVWGEEVGQGEKLFFQNRDAVGRKQREAAPRGQHRVQH